MTESSGAPIEWGRALRGGVVAGIIAGAVLALYLVVTTWVQGGDPWVSVKIAGLPFIGAEATQPGYETLPVVVGVLGHFAVSIFWGVLFALAAFGMSSARTVGFGLLWGLLVWVAMYYVVLPIVGASELARATPVPMAILTHLVFGLVLGVGFLPYQRRRPRGGRGRVGWRERSVHAR